MADIKEGIPRKDLFRLVGFLYSYFFYLLKKNVDTFLIDQLGRKSFPLLADDDNEGSDDDQKQVGFKAPADESEMIDLLTAEEINEFWVLGETCSHFYSQLSVQERQLLKWRYVDELRSSEISKKISEHPNTVREHLSKIKAKVVAAVIESKGEEDKMFRR